MGSRTRVVTAVGLVGALTMAGCAAPEAEENGLRASGEAPVVRIDTPAPDPVVELGVDEPITFAATVVDPNRDALEVVWDFGDGTTAQGAGPPAHRYALPGTYLVTLSAEDLTGARATPATRIVQVGAPEPVTGNHALSFGATGRDDVDRVKIPQDDPTGQRVYGANIGATDMTIEFWMRAAPGANATGPVECGENVNWINGNIVVDRDRWGPGRSYGLSLAGGMLVFGVANDRQLTVCGSTRVDDGQWHHVAVTREVATGAVELFVDGRSDGRADSGPAGDFSYPPGATPESNCPGELPCTLSDPYLVIGAEKHDVGPDYPGFRGEIDELRLSTVARYTGPFDVPSGRFEPDPDTAALYHFDEGGGPVVGDAVTGPGSSPGVVRYGGEPVGPVWVRSGAPTGQ